MIVFVALFETSKNIEVSTDYFFMLTNAILERKNMSATLNIEPYCKRQVFLRYQHLNNDKLGIFQFDDTEQKKLDQQLTTRVNFVLKNSAL